MRGRVPKSTEAHKADGTYRKHRHAKTEGIDPLKKLPAAPTWLGAAAKKVWAVEGKKLVDGRLLTLLDLNALAQYCETWALWRKAQGEIASGGLTYESEQGPRKHPAVQIFEAQSRALVTLQDRLGLNVVARVRARQSGGAGSPSEKTDLEQFQSSAP